MYNRAFISSWLALCAACGGASCAGHEARPDGSGAPDASQPMDAASDVPNRPGLDGSIIVTDPPGLDGSIVVTDPRAKDAPPLPPPDRAGPILAPDGRPTWPRADSAVETPDADTWDAGQGCPVVTPVQGDPCAMLENNCSYPIDCCGIVAGFFRAYCQNGAWLVITEPNGEYCAPCDPFPREGEACSPQTACQSGPPLICLARSCYAKAVVARCAGDRWTVSNGCDK